VCCEVKKDILITGVTPFLHPFQIVVIFFGYVDFFGNSWLKRISLHRIHPDGLFTPSSLMMDIKNEAAT
jgi:hypothetical protein